MDFKTFKKAFLLKFEELENNFYFREATGYECVDRGTIRGIWGDDIETFFYLQLGKHNIWPIGSNLASFDEPMLFTIIEFLYDYVSEPQRKWYHPYYDCGWHTADYDRDKGKRRYRNEINNILKDYGSGYVLSEFGEVLFSSPNGLENLAGEIVETGERNIDESIRTAISKYRRHNATLEDKKDAIRNLADVLEYLRKEGIRLPSKDDDDLFNIINNFDIRHHNRMQHNDYSKEIWYEWMFYTFLSSINVLLKLLRETS